jgi:hypothetical protein
MSATAVRVAIAGGPTGSSPTPDQCRPDVRRTLTVAAGLDVDVCLGLRAEVDYLNSAQPPQAPNALRLLTPVENRASRAVTTGLDFDRRQPPERNTGLSSEWPSSQLGLTTLRYRRTAKLVRDATGCAQRYTLRASFDAPDNRC